MKLLLLVLSLCVWIQPVWAHVPKCSAFGAYTDLIQTIDCPKDAADYGEYSNYGYYGGGYWCGQVAAAGYWVYNYPTWHIYRTKVEVKQQKNTETIQPVNPEKQHVQSENVQEQSSSDDSDSWAVYLKGKHLLYMKTTAYVRNKWHFWLCSNQQFYYRSQGGSVDVGAGFSAASQGANSGQWQVDNEQTLVLRYGNGDVEQYDLSYTNDTLYLNGRRYFVVDNDVCD